MVIVAVDVMDIKGGIDMFNFKNSCDGYYRSMDVRVTKKCDNNCSFCIEKNGECSLGETNDKKIIESINSVDIDDILLLGGEPLLELKKVINIVENVNPNKKVYLTTSLPNTIIDEDDISIDMMYLMDMIDGLNISFHGGNDEENINTLQASSKHSRLKLINRLSNLYPDKVRVCINLVKGCIDDTPKLMNVINMLYKNGVRKIKINELQHTPELYVSIEKILNRKWKSPYAHGCQTKVNEGDLEITYKRSCFIVEPSLNPSLADFIKIIIKKFGFVKNNGKFCVCYENGMVSNKWITRVDKNIKEMKLNGK